VNCGGDQNVVHMLVRFCGIVGVVIYEYISTDVTENDVSMF
jgi:hypothetical protein